MKRWLVAMLANFAACTDPNPAFDPAVEATGKDGDQVSAMEFTTTAGHGDDGGGSVAASDVAPDDDEMDSRGESSADEQNSTSSGEGGLETIDGATTESSESSGIDDQIETSTETEQGCAPVACLELNVDGHVDDQRMMSRGIAAYKVPLTSGLTEMRRIELYTGEITGTLRLALWSSNASTPERRLGSGEAPLEFAKGWQGVDFDPPIDLSQVSGDFVWVTWDTIVGAQSSIALAGTQVPYWYSFDFMDWMPGPGGAQRSAMVRGECCR